MVGGNTRKTPNHYKVAKHNENTSTISSTGNTTDARKRSNRITSTDISTGSKETPKNMANVTRSGISDNSDSDEEFLNSPKSLFHDNSSYNGRKRRKKLDRR